MTPSPWPVAALLRFASLTVVALGLLVVGWVGVSGRADTMEQMVWLNVSVGGLVVSLWANSRLLLDGRREVGLRVRAVRRPAPLDPPSPATSAADGDDDGRLVAGAGLRRFHRPSCSLAAGRGWDAVDRTEHHAAGRRPCGVCRP